MTIDRERESGSWDYHCGARDGYEEATASIITRLEWVRDCLYLKEEEAHRLGRPEAVVTWVNKWWVLCDIIDELRKESPELEVNE